MTDSPFRERRYRIEEVRDVVKDALAREPEPALPGRALTAAELGQLLTDLGVSTEAAGRALDEAGTRTAEPAGTERSLLGGPRRLVFEGEVDGELPDERREDLVELIRDEMGDTGRLETLGRTLTWMPGLAPNGQARRLSVKVRVREGRTRIRIDEDLSPVRIGSWVGFGFGGAFGLGFLGVAIGKAAHSAAVALLAWALIVAGCLFAAHLVTRAVTRRRRRELGRLFDKLQKEVARGVVPRARVAAPEPRPAGEASEEAAREEEASEEEAREEAARQASAGRRRAR